MIIMLTYFISVPFELLVNIHQWFSTGVTTPPKGGDRGELWGNELDLSGRGAVNVF